MHNEIFHHDLFKIFVIFLKFQIHLFKWFVNFFSFSLLSDFKIFENTILNWQEIHIAIHV